MPCVVPAALTAVELLNVMAGVVIDGLVASTTEPVPVDVVSVGASAAAPVPVDV